MPPSWHALRYALVTQLAVITDVHADAHALREAFAIVDVMLREVPVRRAKVVPLRSRARSA